MPEATGLAHAAPARTAHRLPGWSGTTGAQATPAEVQDAFEALLVSELLKPLEESLRGSGLFPQGAAGDIYAHFWKQQMGELLAQQIELLPASDGTARAREGGSPGAPPRPGEQPGTALAPGELASLPERGAGLARRSGMPPARWAASSAAQRTSAAADATAPAERAARAAAQAPAATGADPQLARFLQRLAPFEDVIRSAAEQVTLGVNWVRAVIRQESGGDPRAVSRSGAQGLMQLMPATGAALGVRDAFDPAENIRAGVRYLAALQRRFGDMRLALAAYNAGPSRVAAHGGVPPIRETREYIERVLAFKAQLDAWDGR